MYLLTACTQRPEGRYPALSLSPDTPGPPVDLAGQRQTLPQDPAPPSSPPLPSELASTPVLGHISNLAQKKERKKTTSNPRVSSPPDHPLIFED